MIFSSLTEALGWTLLHSLWQASLVALAFYGLRLLVRRPTYVHRLGITALLAVAGWAVYTFTATYEPPTSTVVSAVPKVTSAEFLLPANDLGNAPRLLDTPWSESLAHRLRPYLHWVALGWLLGMLGGAARLLGGLWYLQRLRHRYTTPLPDWEPVLARLANRLHLRRPVALRASGAARAPMVVGYLKPVILLPASLVSQLPPDQIEAILAHELAHVHRHDYWINILQSVVEAVFFYHPAVWWMSSVVRAEREKCCDDRAVALCGNPLVYARALSEAEAWQQAPAFALAFARQRSGLLARIERLVHPHPNTSHPTVKLLLIVLAVLTIVYLSAGSTLADQSQRWLNNLRPPVVVSGQPLASLLFADTIPARTPQVTLPPVIPPAPSDDGWRSSDKARAYQVPVDPDTVPDPTVADVDTAQNGTFFRYADSSDFIIINPASGVKVVTRLPTAPPPARFNFDDQRHGYSYVFSDDSIPALSDSLWRESLGDLSVTMDDFSEELAGWLADSISAITTDALQEQLGTLQMELGQLQAELGLSLQHSLSEEETEALQEELQEGQKRLEREVERAHRDVAKAREKQREVAKRRREEAMARAKEQRARAQQYREEALERAEKQREAARQYREEARQKRTSISFNNGVELDELISELQADKLIQRGEKYRFKLKSSGLYINGKKQSDAMFKKYQELLDASEDSHFSINGTAD